MVLWLRLLVDAGLGLKLTAFVDMRGAAVVKGLVTGVGVNSFAADEIYFVFISLFWAVKLLISGPFMFCGLVKLKGFVAEVLIGGEKVKLFASKLKLEAALAGGAYILGIGIWVLIAARPLCLGLNDWAFMELRESEFDGGKVCD